MLSFFIKLFFEAFSGHWSKRLEKEVEMKFIGNVRLLFENEEIPLVVLEKFRSEWSKFALLPGILGNKWSSRKVVLSLLCQTIPFDIVADELTGQLVLQLELGRFPYSINEREGFQAFSLRLVPTQGRIALAQMDNESRVAVNTFETTTDSLRSNVANGSAYVEIYYGRQPNLPALAPPKGYKPVVFYDESQPAGFWKYKSSKVQLRLMELCTFFLKSQIPNPSARGPLRRKRGERISAAENPKPLAWAGAKANSKHEIQNSKQYQIFNIKIRNTAIPYSHLGLKKKAAGRTERLYYLSWTPYQATFLK